MPFPPESAARDDQEVFFPCRRDELHLVRRGRSGKEIEGPPGGTTVNPAAERVATRASRFAWYTERSGARSWATATARCMSEGALTNPSTRLQKTHASATSAASSARGLTARYPILSPGTLRSFEWE